MKKIFSKILIIICFFGLLSPVFVLAIGNINTGISDLKTKIAPGAGFNQTDTPDIVIGNTIGLALGLVGIIFLILMVYGGFLWMTARGESEPVEKAQKIIKAAIIGIIIVMSAYAITVLVTGRLSTGGTGAAPVKCTDPSSEGKTCGENGAKNMICNEGICKTRCNVEFPAVTTECKPLSQCTGIDYTTTPNLCPGETAEDGICCHRV